MRSGEPSPDDLRARLAARALSVRARGSRVWVSLVVFAEAHARLLLCLLAVMPYLHGLWQILGEGVPDVLLTGDAATLELRILHAAQGKQWLGPYSRFLWSHPGPAMFYLALPFYELLHRRGPALNVFAFAVSASCAVALVLNGRKLRGNFFALMLALLFGVYQVVGVPFAMSSGWNPNVPIFPLALLGILAARLTVGSPPGVLLAFVFLASAIVQTHVGYLPVVLVEAGVALVGSVARWLWPSDAPRLPRAWRRGASRVFAALLVLATCWALPIFEQAVIRPGNLAELFRFFTRPHHADHTWTASLVEVFRQTAVMPAAVARAFHLAGGELDWPTVRLLGWAELALLVGALIVGFRRRDSVFSALAAICLGAFLASVSAVHEIRGEIHPYLLYWISTVGFLMAVVCAAGLDRLMMRGRAARAASAAVTCALFLGLLIAVNDNRGREQIFVPRDVAVEKLARAVESGLAARPQVQRPVVHIVSQSAWPAALAIVLDLAKKDIPIAVEPNWLYMVGTSLAPRATERFWLVFGDASYASTASARLDQTLVASSGGVCVYLRDTAYLDRHRLVPRPESVSAFGVLGNRATLTDDVLPFEGTQWDSPASLVLTSTASAIEVAIPYGDLVGIYLSADGNDLYSLRCVGAEGLSWLAGPGRPEEAEAGMRTRLVFTDTLGSCQSIEVKPAAGDGAYAIGELGFLRR